MFKFASVTCLENISAENILHPENNDSLCIMQQKFLQTQKNALKCKLSKQASKKFT